MSHVPRTAPPSCVSCGGTGRADELFRRGAEVAGLPPDTCIECGGTGLLVLDDECFVRENRALEVRRLGARAGLLDAARERLGPTATEDEVQAAADLRERSLERARERLGPDATADEVVALGRNLEYRVEYRRALLGAARDHLGPTATEEDVQVLADEFGFWAEYARGRLGPGATEEQVAGAAKHLQYLSGRARELLGPTATEKDVQHGVLAAATLLGHNPTDEEMRAVIDGAGQPDETEKPAAARERGRAMVEAMANSWKRPGEEEATWYGRLRDTLFTVVFLGAVAFGAVSTLVEPWSTYVVQAAFWLALLALLHGVRLLSAIRRSFPIVIGSGLLFLFGQVAVHERFQEPFVFWPVVIAVGAVLYQHDLCRWIREEWAARRRPLTARRDGGDRGLGAPGAR